MAAKYILRFDDLCPTAAWPVWNRVEAMLTARNWKPIVAVVPDNQDVKLRCAPADSNFWQRVRDWQSAGWAVGLHGYQHRYVTRESGLVGRNSYSEFAGLPEREQRRKIAAGLEIFASHGVKADVWIAPAHSFDRITVDVLASLGVDCISDGYSLYPYRAANGQLWVPQQIAKFRPLPSGIWTVCHHVNGWNGADLANFEADLNRFGADITDLQTVAANYARRGQSFTDRLLATGVRSMRTLRAATQPGAAA